MQNKVILSIITSSWIIGTAFAAPTAGTGTNSVVLNNGTASGSNSIVGGGIPLIMQQQTILQSLVDNKGLLNHQEQILLF